MAIKSIFIGSKRQVTNQWIQFFILVFTFVILFRYGFTLAGIKNEGWGVAAFLIKSGVSYFASYMLIRGRLGEFLNGKREVPEVEPDPGTAYYPIEAYPGGQRAPKRTPYRQPEENEPYAS